MNIKKKRRILILLAVSLLAIFASGIQINATTKSKIAFKSTYHNKQMRVGKQKRIYVVQNGKNVSGSKVIWKSSNPNVATIKNGLLKTKGYGSVIISARLKNSSSNTIKFVLWVYESQKSVKFSNMSNPYVLEIGASRQLKPTVKENYLKYSSSDRSVVSVTSNGKIKAKKEGTATITYVSIGRYYCKGTIKIIVGKRMTAVESGVTDNVLTIKVGEKYSLSPIAVPSNAAYKMFAFSSTSKNIVSVNSEGVLNAKAVGTANIKIKARDSSGKYAIVKVNVVKEISDDNLSENTVQIIAHRGLASQAPENSLPAFQLAGKSGFDAIECDVRVTKDGQIVVIHDASLSRMCGVNLNVADLTLSEIKRYPIINGSNADKYPNNYILTLDEFIAVCNQYICTPVVEIKGNFTDEALQKVYTSIKKSVKSPIVISFYRYNLRWLRKKDANLELQNVAWEASEYELAFCRQIKVDMSAQYVNLTADQIKRIQAEGIKIATWNINDLSTFNYFKSIGVNAISTEMDFA